MTAVSVSYILFAPRPEGFGLDIFIAVAAGIVATLFAALFAIKVQRLPRADDRLCPDITVD